MLDVNVLVYAFRERTLHHTQYREWLAAAADSDGARGNLVADAYLAALAIESGCEWITTDRDFSRFVTLRWRHPLAPPA